MDSKRRKVERCHKQKDEDDTDGERCRKAKKRKITYAENKEHGGSATGMTQVTAHERSQGEHCALRELETVGVTSYSVKKSLLGDIKDGKLPKPRLLQGTQLLSPGDVDRIRASTSTTTANAEPNLDLRNSRAQLSTSSFVHSQHVPLGVPDEPEVTLTEPEVPLTEPQVPLTEPQVPLTEPEEPLTEPQVPLTGPEEPLTEPQVPLTGPEEPLTDPQVPLTEPQVPLTELQVPLTAELLIPLTNESDTESEGCTTAKRQRKNKNIKKGECVDLAMPPEEEEGVASPEADVGKEDAENSLCSDFTDGEEEEEGNQDGIGHISQLGAGAAKVKFQTVKQKSYKLVDKGTTSLAKHAMGCYRNVQEQVSQPQLCQGTQLHPGGEDQRQTFQPQLHQGRQLNPTGEEDQRQTSSLTPCLETSPRTSQTQLSTSSFLPRMSNIEESVVSEIQSLGVPEVPLTTDSESPLAGATQYNFIQVQQQFGEVTVQGARNLSIGGTQNFGKPVEEEEEEKPVSTVHKIRKRTTSRTLSWTKGMVETEGLQQVIDRIERGATWVTIKGRPGEGKSTVAYMALNDQHSKGRQVFQVVSPEEFNEVIMACPHPVIMLDDIFGDLEFDRAEWAKWRPSLRPILDVKDVDKLTDSVTVVAGPSDGTRSALKQSKRRGPPKKGPVIILVGRDYVLKSSLTDLGRMADYITNIQHVVEISTRRDTEEKRKIWNSIAQRKNIDFSKTVVAKILQADCPHGFPHVCKMFVTEYEKEKNLISVESFFNKPLGFLNQTLNKFFADRNKCDLFKAMALRDGQISEQHIPRDDCTSAANDLVGSYLKKEDDVYMFDHPSIFDTVALILIQNHTSFVIEKCSLPFIHQRLRLKPSTRSVDDAAVDTDLVAHIPQCYAVQLAMRFAAEVQRRNLLHVLSHQACCDVEFIDKLMNFLKTGGHASVPSMLSLTDKSSHQSFCELLSSNKSHEFINYIMMKENVQFSPNGIKEILLGVCKNAAGSVLTYMKEDMHFDINTRYGLDHKTPLMIAAGTRNISFVKQILSLNPDLNAADRRDKSVLHYICENGLTSAVEYIVDKGVEVNVQMAFQQMPLYLAIQNGHIEVVKLLLNRGCESDNQKGLLCAIGSDKIDMVKLFLDRGAHVERNDLFVACERGKPDIVKLLFEKSASINKQASDGKTFLHKAIGWGYKRADVLLKAGADPNIQTNTGDTPLHTAANFGFVDCADVLLTAGANVNAQNEEGDTPLHRAVNLQCKNALVDVLVKAGADVSVKNNSGDTPLHIAIPCPSLVCVDIRQEEEDETIQGSSGDTQLHTAANMPFLDLLTDRGNVNVHNVRSAVTAETKECLKKLLKAGVDVNVQNKAGDTPLHKAATGMSKESIDVLLRAGANVNVQNKAGDTPLHKAATGMSKESIDVLLRAGANVNVQNKEGDTPLHSALAAETKECVIMLLKAGADVNVQNNKGYTPLHTAVATQTKEFVDMLLKAEDEAGVNVQTKEGNTPLHLAVICRSKDCVNLLLEIGAHVNIQNNKGDSLLHTAATSMSKECVDLFLRAGADVNVQNKDGDTPLHTAVEFEFKECIEELLKSGADVNIQNNKGDSLLHTAAASMSKECVDLFLKAGADVDEQNRDGDTPLHVAVKLEFFECIEELLKSGAEVNIQNKKGDSLLHIATGSMSRDCVDLFLKAGAHANVQNRYGDTPLHTAVEFEFKECVDLFLKAGADVNIQNAAGDTPLHVASKSISLQCGASLKKAGANVNIQNNRGNSSLHIAVAHQSRNKSADLITLGGDANIQNTSGNTPLHLAAGHQSVDCLAALVSIGAEVNKVNNAGDTPLHLAVANRSVECVAVLIKAGAEVNEQNNAGDTPLHLSAGRSVDCLATLVDVGAELNVHNMDGNTPLHIAASMLTNKYVMVLLKAGADVNVQNTTGDTPLHTAGSSRSKLSVIELLKASADVNVRNNKGDTPLHKAAETTVCVDVLLKAGADVNVQNTTGDTPLHTAASSRSKLSVIELLKASADVDVLNNKGDTPLHKAVESTECVDMLLKAGADVSVQNTTGDTPLHTAASSRSKLCIDQLLKAGADVNVLNDKGDTPLHKAVESTECVDMLLKAGADVSVQNTSGDTPLHTAASSRSKLSVIELLKAGADVNVQNTKGDTPFPSGGTCWPEEWDQEWMHTRAHLLMQKRRHHCVIFSDFMWICASFFNPPTNGNSQF